MDTSKPIKGVEFTITGPKGYSKTATTDEEGKIALINLAPGEYTVEETSTSKSNPKVELPTDGTTQTVTVKNSKDVKTATFSDELTTGNLEITKTVKGSDNTPVDGVEFTITGPNDYSKTVKTDKNGKISLQGLTPGEYTVTESSVDGASPAVEAPSADDKT